MTKCIVKLVWLLFIFSFVEAKKYYRLASEDVKDIYCPDCEELKSGMIRNFFVSDFDGRKDRFQKCKV